MDTESVIANTLASHGRSWWEGHGWTALCGAWDADADAAASVHTNTPTSVTYYGWLLFPPTPGAHFLVSCPCPQARLRRAAPTLIALPRQLLSRFPTLAMCPAGVTCDGVQVAVAVTVAAAAAAAAASDDSKSGPFLPALKLQALIPFAKEEALASASRLHSSVLFLQALITDCWSAHKWRQTSLQAGPSASDPAAWTLTARIRALDKRCVQGTPEASLSLIRIPGTRLVLQMPRGRLLEMDVMEGVPCTTHALTGDMGRGKWTAWLKALGPKLAQQRTLVVVAKAALQSRMAKARALLPLVTQACVTCMRDLCIPSRWAAVRGARLVFVSSELLVSDKYTAHVQSVVNRAVFQGSEATPATYFGQQVNVIHQELFEAAREAIKLKHVPASAVTALELLPFDRVCSVHTRFNCWLQAAFGHRVPFWYLVSTVPGELPRATSLTSMQEMVPEEEDASAAMTPSGEALSVTAEEAAIAATGHFRTLKQWMQWWAGGKPPLPQAVVNRMPIRFCEAQDLYSTLQAMNSRTESRLRAQLACVTTSTSRHAFILENPGRDTWYLVRLIGGGEGEGAGVAAADTDAAAAVAADTGDAAAADTGDAAAADTGDAAAAAAGNSEDDPTLIDFDNIGAEAMYEISNHNLEEEDAVPVPSEELHSLTLDALDTNTVARNAAYLRAALAALVRDAPSLHRRLQDAVTCVTEGCTECPLCASRPCDAVYPCGHAFCAVCMMTWRATANLTCPMCKQAACTVVSVRKSGNSGASLLAWVRAAATAAATPSLVVCQDQTHCRLLAQALGGVPTLRLLRGCCKTREEAIKDYVQGRQSLCVSLKEIVKEGLRLPKGGRVVLVGDWCTEATARKNVCEALGPASFAWHQAWTPKCGDGST